MFKRRWFVSAVLVSVGVLAGLVISIKFNIAQPARAQQQKPPMAQVPAQADVGATDSGFEGVFEKVAADVGKAVVSISAEQNAGMGGQRRYRFRSPRNGSNPFGGNGGNPFGGEGDDNGNGNGPNDEFFRRFFDDFFGGMPDREYKRVGLGSGFIIDPEGIILTNQHVIDEADKITVTLPDGREFKAEIKGQDPRSDLAVIKINAKDLPVLRMGDSANVRSGQWVVAVGNPFGFAMQNPEPTITAGVVSALHRSLGRAMSHDKNYNDLIQTDAAINPGNSGGPLVDLKGTVVGINVAIFSTTGGNQGIGFAIPINSAKRILSRLVSGKPIEYGWLGITVQDLTQDLAQYFGLSDKNGILVVNVVQDGPGDKAGLKEGDIIKQVGDIRVNSVKELLTVVGNTEVGKKLPVKLLRDKKEMTLDVTIGTRPVEEEIAGGEGQEQGIPRPGAATIWRGLAVEELDSEAARRFQLESKEGVVVVAVKPGSPADDSELVPGDVIIEINKQKVSNLADYRKVIKTVKGQALVRTSRGYFVLKEPQGGKQ
ncbi:MAG: Do family serine endopeptidase [Deltaproteobacteria bacterium]